MIQLYDEFGEAQIDFTDGMPGMNEWLADSYRFPADFEAAYAASWIN